MRTILRTAVIAVCVGSFLLLAFLGPRLYARHRIHQLTEMDHRILLAECRGLIASNGPRLALLTDPEAQVGLERHELPRTLRRLRPAYVLVRRDDVFICLSVIPRLYLIGFAKGAEEYGELKLTDGLWFSSDPADDLLRAGRRSN